MANDIEKELNEAVDRILASESRKKLVVAGPGAGKTTLFRKLLDKAAGDAKRRLVLTFINNLKVDLDRSLGDAAEVFTLHGYCQHLLHRHAPLRNGLSADFVCYPGLVSLIKRDWQWLQKSDSPKFVEMMRDLECSVEHDSFYTTRANYYDAVDFDDSVHRTCRQLAADLSLVPAYELVLIDEFQDFNTMEASVIDMLAERNCIVIAGDDDQALYSQLRGASWDHIRAYYESGHYEIFELPFCMRCPEVIVAAVNDVILKARHDKKLQGRIEKPYRYYEPLKGDDSRRYPKIDLVETSVQRGNANYFGRYIEQCINAVSDQDVKLAAEKNEPVALVIGSNPYRRQVEDYLIEAGLVSTEKQVESSDEVRAFEFLTQNAQSNLGWRIALAEGDPILARDLICAAAESGVSLFEVISDDYRAAVLRRAQAWAANRAPERVDGVDDAAIPKVKVTSFEGAKGLSAQYVFLIGIHSGEMPRNAAAVQDIEICRFLVGLTRTKKKCSILVTNRFGQEYKTRSEFLSWIRAERFEEKKVNAAYWQR
jgi:superfamily I DNA/RNA helicase